MSMPLPGAMLIDLDDTIISHSTHAEACWKETCKRFSAHLDGLAPQTLYTTIQEARTWFWSDPERHRINRLNMPRAQRRVVSDALRRLGIQNPNLAHQIADTFEETRQKAIVPFPGAIETLERLKTRGVRLALITNGASEPQRHKIDRFNLAPYFDAILVEGECGYGKPDERIYRRALDLLDATPAEAWIVGDNLEWEIAAPQRLGIYSIWHDPTGKGLPESSPIRPDRIIRALSELL